MNSTLIRPVITGIGLATPLGASAPKTWDALLAGKFISSHARVPIDFPADRPRVSYLAICAATEAIASTAGSTILHSMPLVVGTSKGPVEEWLVPPSRLSDVKHHLDFGLSQTATDIARTLDLTGPRVTISAACASGLHALIRGAMLIQSGEAEQVLVVAAESSVHPLFLGSFDRLGVLPSSDVGCRPFDTHREGFLMSESAAAVILESVGSGSATTAIERFALGADATHLTGGDPNGTTLRAILASVLTTEPMDLIHAHGTGTVMNDSTELAALESIIPEPWPKPSLYSHKGALGHSLGAAGLVSVVINVMCHRAGVVPPNIRTIDPMQMQRLIINRGSPDRAIKRSLVVAAGFGGAIAAVALRDI